MKRTSRSCQRLQACAHGASLLRRRWTPIAASLLLGVAARANAQGLQVNYGAKGVQTLSFNGISLEDTGAFPSDSFHIWHMKATDLSGNVMASGQYGWGENNQGESWNAATDTETYSFSWGTIATQFAQNGNNLDLTVTETNYASSGIVFDGAEIYPLALHLPADPVGFNGYSQYAITTTGPGVSAADFGSGIVTAVIPNESVALYGGWKNTGGATYTPMMTSTAPDSLPPFLPHNDHPVQPGTSFSYTVSLRFTPEGTVANAADAYASFAATYPSQMTWTDKRIIGTAYLASSPSGAGDNTQPGGFPTNPRRYFNDPTVDITSPAGLRSFQNRMLAQAAANVTNAGNLNGQGVITWDIEGEQYPQTTSYVCSPDQIAAVAPEMESTVSDPGSPFYGQKLDDAYFQTMSNAGLKTGVCLRPQVFTFGLNNTASQVYLGTNAAIIANLENKARYANTRWGTTIFYVDSTVDSNGGTLDPAIFQQLIFDLPNMLFIPEESTPRYYAYTAPFYTFLFHTDLGTPASIYNIYPHAFGANLVNDVSAATLAAYTPQLTQSVAHGDILMGHADYWQANNPALVAIYRAAGSTANPPLQPTAPAITWPAPAPVTYGAALSAAQLDAVANVAGTFTYTPSLGTVPGAGITTLTAHFTPSDMALYTAASAQVNLTVAKATPTITWSAPSAITAGTPLSSLQLNATANIAGTFSYTPSAGTVLNAGTTQLSVTFTPADTADFNTDTANVPLTVAPQTNAPIIAWPTPSPLPYGTALGNQQLNATANIPGSFAYTPSAGTILNAGTQTLSATFTPADRNVSSVSASRTLSITQAAPQLSWANPAPITYGTALSPSQLNASANIPGTFTYTPAPGTVLNVGSYTLSAVFTPADTSNYTIQSTRVSLLVNSAATASNGVTILSPGSGLTVSGTIAVLAQINRTLDAAGSYLMVDGAEIGSQRVTGGPYIYPLDTRTLPNGQHTLQIWAHDIGNNTVISPTIVITVQN